MINMNKNSSREGKMLMRELMKFKRSYRLQVLCNTLLRGIVLAIALVVSTYVFQVAAGTQKISPWFFMIPLFLSILYPLFKPINTAKLAFGIDKKLGLKERLVTSLCYLHKSESFSTFLLRDTLDHLKMFKPGILFPFNWSRILFLFTIFIGTLILYDMQTLSFSQLSEPLYFTDSVKLVIEKEGDEISQLADRLNKNASFIQPKKKLLIQKLADLGENLKSGKLDKKEALLMLTDVSSSVRQLKKETADSESQLTDNMDHFKNELTDGRNDMYSYALDALKRSKSSIAESDLDTGKASGNNRKNKGSAPGTYASTGSFLRGNMGRDALSRSKSLSATKSSISPGGTNSGSGEAVNTKDRGSIPDGIIHNYPDSVTSLESLPGRYHKMVIQYFDAISKENEID